MKKNLHLTFLLTYKMTVYEKGKRSDASDENLFASTNKMSIKVLISAAITCFSPTKPCFVNENKIKVNKENYCKHLKNSSFLKLKNLLSMMTVYLSKIVLRQID